MRTNPWLLAVGILTLACAAPPEQERSAREEANKAIVRDYLDQIVNRGDFDAWPELFPESVSFNGRKMSMGEMRAMADTFRSILPDLRVLVEEQIADGDVVATRLSFSGTHRGDFMGVKASGKQLTFTGLTYDRIRDGKIVEMWHELDLWGTLLAASDE